MGNRLMQLGSEGMCCVNNKKNPLFAAECLHGNGIQGSADDCAVMQDYVLLTGLRAVEVRRTSLFEHLSSLAALRCPSEYENHTCY